MCFSLVNFVDDLCVHGKCDRRFFLSVISGKLWQIATGRNGPLQLRTPRSRNPGFRDQERTRSHEYPLFNIIDVI